MEKILNLRMELGTPLAVSEAPRALLRDAGISRCAAHEVGVEVWAK